MRGYGVGGLAAGGGEGGVEEVNTLEREVKKKDRFVFVCE